MALEESYLKLSVNLIKPEDVSELLEFERENRTWFESYVPARGDQFYCEQGVLEQIQLFLALYRDKKMFPMIIRDSFGVICGRVNLKDIDININEGIGELGYRMSKSHLKQGIATLAVQHLLDFSQRAGYPKTVKAYVLINNTGSQRVLEKNHFQKTGVIGDFTAFNEKSYSAIEYIRHL